MKRHVHSTHQYGTIINSPAATSIPVASNPSAVNRVGIGWNIVLLLCSSWILANAVVPFGKVHLMRF